MPSSNAYVKCEKCGKQKRINNECGICKGITMKERELADRKERYERNAMQDCCYCQKPAGKVYVESYWVDTNSPGDMSDTGYRVYRPKLTDSDVIVVATYPDQEYSIAHRECQREHLRAEAKKLEGQAAAL